MKIMPGPNTDPRAGSYMATLNITLGEGGGSKLNKTHKAYVLYG